MGQCFSNAIAKPRFMFSNINLISVTPFNVVTEVNGMKIRFF